MSGPSPLPGGDPPAPPNILVVDDDPAMRRMVRDYFEQNNMAASAAAGRQEMDHLLAGQMFSLVLLDLQLGQVDGLDLLRDLRAHSELPVIIMTGHRRDEVDRVVGLELGADDYIIKPFSLRELLARVRVVLRRSNAASAAARSLAAKDLGKPAGLLHFGGWTLDRRTRQLTDPGGRPVALSKGEHALLVAFLNAPRRPLSREHLLQATHVHEDVFDRSIDVQILRLRRKLESDPSAPGVIRTERGVGYVFTLDVTQA